MHNLIQIHELILNAHLDKTTSLTLRKMVDSYEAALQHTHTSSFDLKKLCERYIHFIKESITTPYNFGHIHYAEHYPVDYYEFARDFVRPLIKKEKSCVIGTENLDHISRSLEQGENVILLANHQTEIDPQILSLLLDPIDEHLASTMFFLAGHRVTTDPLAIPFSRGTNILAIYSKKYVDSPPEERSEKLQHNARTLSSLSSLLNEGGTCLYVAASGGRDRLDPSGAVAIAPFDPQSVEMFHLLQKNSTQPTHFHLLALSTIDLLPPPPTTNIELGEDRIVSYAPAKLYFGPRLAFDEIGTSDDRRTRRAERSAALTDDIIRMHAALLAIT